MEIHVTKGYYKEKPDDPWVLYAGCGVVLEGITSLVWGSSVSDHHMVTCEGCKSYLILCLLSKL